MINIPMLCTYTHDTYQLFSDFANNDATMYHETSIRELKRYFDENNKHPLKERLNIILLLFPVRDKKELVIFDDISHLMLESEKYQEINAKIIKFLKEWFYDKKRNKNRSN